MARKLRVQYPGAIYYVMNRGDHLGVIFRAIARRLRAEITLTYEWITQHLSMQMCASAPFRSRSCTRQALWQVRQEFFGGE